jgi:hypothetical protein
MEQKFGLIQCTET